MKLTKTHFEIIKFIIVGGINTLDYYLVYLILLKGIGINLQIEGMALSALSGIILNLILPKDKKEEN